MKTYRAEELAEMVRSYCKDCIVACNHGYRGCVSETIKYGATGDIISVTCDRRILKPKEIVILEEQEKGNGPFRNMEVVTSLTIKPGQEIKLVY